MFQWLKRHSSTKFSPFELLFGFPPELPTALKAPPEFKYSYDDYVSELKLKLQKSHEIARQNLTTSKESNKIWYDKNTNTKPHSYKIGDKVYITNDASKLGRSRKISSRYLGPYEIISVDSKTNVTIRINKKNVQVHVDRLKPSHL